MYKSHRTINEKFLSFLRTQYFAILANLQNKVSWVVILDSYPSLCGLELRPLQPGWRHRGGDARDGEPRPQGLRGVPPLSDQGHCPPEHEGKGLNSQKAKKHQLINVQLKDQGRGELLVSVCHQPAAARLTVVILKARNLPKMDITGMSGEARSNKALRSNENEFNSCEIYSRFIQFPLSQIHMSRFISFTKTREYRKRKPTLRRGH